MLIKKSAEDSVIEGLANKSDTLVHPSRFEFLKEIKGIRPGMLTGLIGTTGSGKSTLLKSVIADTIETERCLVWLSEESLEEYQVKINRSVKDKNKLRNLFFLEENTLQDWVKNSHETFVNEFENIVVRSECKVIFIDNITSSFLYSEDITIKEQGQTARFLQKLCKDLGIAIFYIAHTKKNINDTYSGLITKEDIRGSAKIAIVTEYLFILQKFSSGQKTYPIINIVKHRHHELSNPFFLVAFEDGIYKFDKTIPFELVRKIFNSRNVL